MATIRKIGIQVETQVELILSEEELRAIDALVGYGIKSFLKMFYENLGRSYLEPYEDGLRSFFAAVEGCRGLGAEADECRKFLRQTADERLKRVRNIA